ncbi:MAG TPA: hypothetical protein VL633_01965 [Bacteroidota bacterium]|nr:hypothetical protein [Bacteroidota bacterium]
MNETSRQIAKSLPFGIFLALSTFILTFPLMAGERPFIELKDFSLTEVKSGGFRLPAEAEIHIHARGAGGERSFSSSKLSMYAYGWIINADTREVIWRMDRNNTKSDDKDRTFDGNLTLSKGTYEVYYSAYGYFSSTSFSAFDINIDRRKGDSNWDRSKHRGFFDWLEEFFGDDAGKDWRGRAKDWSIELSVNDGRATVETFAAPREFPRTVFKATKLGENEHIRQQFSLSRPTSLRIYALGERVSDRFADYGWIVNVKTHKREWQMQQSNVSSAGGAGKNIKADETVDFPAGDYSLYYISDDSHSYVDWNAPPPDDPFNYGITLIAASDKDKENFKLGSNSWEDKNVIVQLIRVGNDATRSENFSLKQECSLHIYALGEEELSHHEMADYGWIIDARTRQRVWTMDYDRTENAGGAEKNRMIDEVITLPKGDYTALYRTDGSHAYNDWNSSPPFDPEHWGITISGEGDNFVMNAVERNTTHQSGIIAQIVRVGNNANRTVSFKIDKSGQVRVYALGEGQNREMFDYGWIENSRTSQTVWEMTYSMTFHAGGGRKNRMVNSTVYLEKGEYTLHYTSDDSHSFNDWNTDPPDDQTMWGITLYSE